MKLKQKELKKTMRGILAGACLLAIGSAVVFAVGTETEMKAYAAEWQQAENGDWTYAEDEGSHATGWQKIDGVWYYLEPETGVWNSHPALDQTSVCYLVENAVNRQDGLTGKFRRTSFCITESTVPASTDIPSCCRRKTAQTKLEAH